jgi:predicted phage-related endonuclease
MATLDRTVVGTTTAVEIKTTNRYITEPSRYWWWQCQVQLLCTGFTSVDLVVLDPSFELQCFTVAPDEEYQELIAEAGRKFLEHVRRGELPPEVDLTYRAASIMHPEPVATAVELDEEVLLRCRQLRNVSARIKSLQVDEDALKGMIGHALGDAAEGRHDDATVVTWRSVTRHGVDQKRLRAEHPEIAKELTTETKYRRLMVKEPK